jgi:hypothetical protein
MMKATMSQELSLPALWDSAPVDAEAYKPSDLSGVSARLQIGWFIGTDRFEPEGEFFRATLDKASYRWQPGQTG